MSTLFPVSSILEEPPLTWFGQTTKSYTGTINSLRQYIPKFSRTDFNAYLDQINRQPIGNDESVIPVATVSKQYALIQHQDLIDAVASGLNDLGFNPDTLAAQLRLSDYGERMHLRMMLVNEAFNPGDDNLLGIALNCINSVDRSTSLELRISWHRLVCDNGMYLTDSDKMRRVHLGSLKREDITDYLKSQLAETEIDKTRLTDWYKTPVTVSQVEAWADDDVAANWGVFLAARTCHIARTGFDGEVAGVAGRVRPSVRDVSSKRHVPGACAPVTNVYHVSQVLSWLARDRNTVQDQFERMMEIPGLINPLLN
jgi:hypothetical protein